MQMLTLESSIEDREELELLQLKKQYVRFKKSTRPYFKKYLQVGPKNMIFMLFLDALYISFQKN